MCMYRQHQSLPLAPRETHLGYLNMGDTHK